MKRLLTSTLLFAVVTSGCGSNQNNAVPSTPTTATKAQHAKPSAPTSGTVDADTQAAADVAWSRNRVDLLQFCVHKLGAREGLQQPPSAAMTREKNLAVLNLRLLARDTPTIRLGGQPLEMVITKAESDLTRGSCDIRAAKRLRDTLDALESHEPVKISEAEKEAAAP